MIKLELSKFGNSPANNRSQAVPELGCTITQATTAIEASTYTLAGASFEANRVLWQTPQSPDSIETLGLISPDYDSPGSDLSHQSAGRYSQSAIRLSQENLGITIL